MLRTLQNAASHASMTAAFQYSVKTAGGESGHFRGLLPLIQGELFFLLPLAIVIA
jgi:hypothetical protein